MKILHTISSVRAEDGGPIEGIKQLASVAIAKGHSVEVASLDAPGAPFLEAFPLRVHALGPPLSRYSYSSRFVLWLHENAQRYDVVIVDGIWQYQCFGTWRALRNSSVPYVVFPHGMLDPWFKRRYPLKHLKKWLYWPWANYPALRDAAAVVFTCEEERRLARESFWLYRAREVVVHYGTAAPSGDGAAQCKAFLDAFPELKGTRRALFMGRLHEKKGCDILLDAFARTLARDPEWRLVMAGPDENGLGARLTAQAAALGLRDRVTFTGMLQGDLKWGALRSAEVFVLPSHQENFGVVVVEALACGTPVLISDKVNIAREISARGAGLTGSDTVDGTTRMLTRWTSMPIDEQDEMARRAVQCFAEKFEINAASRSLINALDAARTHFYSDRRRRRLHEQEAS